eukprot:gnl/MRDRNA2_/MRDRNA2_90194_c0_seq1.p1 gnl/MRDRNA2_/MRDRNA2_90194_c0~~gnl/MRDRNA2_/MRDRNA2_90194_c0_seq1.p1  ORF type:complete len:706 (-),score=123.92 gnl/MRDRNA2_/MRDRNA2_90194_c0_seq1:121-2238(-)
MKITPSMRHGHKSIPGVLSAVSLRHAKSGVSEDPNETRPRASNMRRGVTFSDDEYSSQNSIENDKEGVFSTGQSIPTCYSRSTDHGISLRVCGSEKAVSFKDRPSEEQGWRNWFSDLIMSQNFEMFAGFVILGNFIAIILETDARAKMYDEPVDSDQHKSASDLLSSCDKANFAFLVFYAMECLARVFVLRKAFLSSKWNIFDMIIVIVGAVGQVLESVFGSMGDSSMEHFQVLRSLRMLRLLRAARVVISFKELYSLIAGMSSCLRTLIWAAGLVFLMLTMWSITAVEFLHHYVSVLSKEGFYDDCTYCSQSFSSIMLANLTFFQIVSGDGWSDLARPLIMKHPWTAILFVGVIFTMVFGMLNLITAVIVDTAAQAREADVLHMAAQKEYERKFAWETVASICVGMDTDKDGNITFEELKRGTKKIPELSAHLSVMGVEFDDLQMVFDLLDTEQHGKIPIAQFVNELYKMQTHEHKTTHVFVKHYVEEIRRDVKMMKKLSDEWSKLRDSEDSGKEPETEPKLESPPWMKLYPHPSETDTNTIEYRPENAAIPVYNAVPQDEKCHTEEKQGVTKELHSGVTQPAINSWSPHYDTQPGISLPKYVPNGHSDCSIEDDLEIGQRIGIDDAITQFQNGAFQVLSSAPTSNFAEQFAGKTGIEKQGSSQSTQIGTSFSISHKSTLPNLLQNHPQVLESADNCHHSSKKC